MSQLAIDLLVEIDEIRQASEEGVTRGFLEWRPDDGIENPIDPVVGLPVTFRRPRPSSPEKTAA